MGRRKPAAGRITRQIGTLGGAWHDLESGERRAAAEEIRTRLAGSGIREFMLFDGRRLLQARTAGDDLIVEPPRVR